MQALNGAPKPGGRCTRGLAAVVATCIILAGCGGTTSKVSGGSNPDGAGVENPITVWHPDPSSLVTTNSNEEGGLKVLEMLYTGLINYDKDTTEPKNAVAQSIEPDASKKIYTITLNQGWKFHDGTEVKAHNFVDAWNYGANGNNGQANQAFYAPIAGFAEVAGEFDAKGKLIAKPTAQKLRGLKVNGDYTFTVELTQPLVNFTTRLGVMAFMPQPDSFLADPKAAADKPVGNGPYQFVAWDKGKSVQVKRFPEYSGADKGAIESVRFVMYTDADAAYTDLLDGKLDVMEGVPSSALQADKYKKDLGNRFYEVTELSITTLSIPQSVPALKNPDFAKAISLAIDRPALNNTLMGGTRPPANGWNPPGVAGFAPDACGDLCRFDVVRAKEHLEKAGGFTGTLEISYPKDAGQDELMQGICNMLKQNLGIKCELMPSPDFTLFQDAVKKNKSAMVRMSYQVDYPSVDNILLELYSKRGGSNVIEYDSKAYNDLIAQAMASPSTEQFNELMQKAERQLAVDMPAVPLYTIKHVVGYSERVKALSANKIGLIDWGGVQLS